MKSLLSVPPVSNGVVSPPEEAAVTPPNQGQVLFACECPASHPVVDAVLHELGQTAVLARSAGEALMRAHASDYALILIGYCGDAPRLLETVRRMRANRRSRHTPIVVLGLPAAPQFGSEPLYEAGAVAVLCGPPSSAILKAQLRFYLDSFANAAERRRAETALDNTRARAGEERYRTLFESIDEAMCVIEILFDAAGEPCDYRFLETNSAFITHTGLHGVVGKTIRSLAPRHEQHWFDIYGRVALTGEPVRFVNQALALGRWYDVYAMRIGPAEQRHVAVLFNDITERRRSEEELRRLAADLAEANRLKSEFLATLAHELRNPLAPIRSGLQFMRRTRGDAAAAARVQDIMDRQLGHLVNLVDDLLDVARITRGQVELKRDWIDLAAVLSAAVETSMPLLDAARHRHDLRLPPGQLMLYADATRLTQVVSNLLNNAARYTPQGGSIVLTAERDGEHAVISVADNGIGIAPDALEEVFKMFARVGPREQLNHGGLGIGLSLVRSLVDLHGGSVTAASAGVNAGSVFTVRLPLAPADAPPRQPAPVAALGAATRALRVLVVDDNRDAAETLSALLGLMGHTAPVANEGHQALRMLRSFGPQVVFLDLGMPGMSGYEVAAAIRKDSRFDTVKLVALTGWGGDADRARSAAAGFDLHLTKPVAAEAIENLLARL